MVRNNEGLTKTYNRFHDPNEDSFDIRRMRELHDAMDRVVIDAYRWVGIHPKCEFMPEFEDEEADDENGRTRKKKYRYRWPDEIRDEVLAKLLELNRQRALEEGQVLVEDLASAALREVQPKKGGRKKKIANAAVAGTQPLFDEQEGES
jgi:hypothetical protein